MSHVVWIKVRPKGKRKFGDWIKHPATFLTKEIKEIRRRIKGDPDFKIKVRTKIKARKKIRDIGLYW